MKKIFFSLLCTLFFFDVNSQIITTIAGTGVAGYSGDGARADECEFYYPVNCSIDKNGVLYIVDGGNNRIRKINADGIISTIAGTAVDVYNGDGIPATAANFGAYAIDFDNIGNIYIADAKNRRIRKIDTLGIINTIAGTGAMGSSGDNGPATLATLNQPTGIAVDDSGNIYFPDWDNNCIRMVNRLGIIATIAGTGVAGYSGDGGAATAAKINIPIRVVLDKSGNLYFTDFSQHVRKIDKYGIISTIAGTGFVGFYGDNGQATNAQLNGPAGISVDAIGNIYIADSYNQRIRKIDASGIITTVAGTGIRGHTGDGGPATAADLNAPDGVVIDNDGNLFFTEYGGNTVRKIIYNLAVEKGINTTDVRIYPNPATSVLYFEFPNQERATVRLFDITGRIVAQQEVIGIKTSINVKDYAPGIYFYKITSSIGAQSGKVTIE